MTTISSRLALRRPARLWPIRITLSPGAQLSGLLTIFWLALLPFAGYYVVHHPDERHYTDAAIEMLETGDYVTPRKADSSPRFQKPVLTYWMIAASYHALGVHPLASRLPFVAAAAAAVWLTYHMAWTLLRSRRAAHMAALITMCHPLLLLSATRSIPDMPLCLFLLVASYGFAGLLILGRREPRWYWTAYGGVALAVATKGLPALVLIAFAWAYASVNPWRRTAWRELLHWPSMLAAACGAGAWFAAAYTLHGEQLVHVFWNDQVAERITSSRAKPVVQFLLAAVLAAIGLLPWSLPWLAALWRRPADLLPPDSRRRELAAFVLGWSLLMCLLIGMVVKFSVRYLLPISPLLAILLADQLDRCDTRVLQLAFCRLLRITLGLLVLLLALAVVLAAQQSPSPWELFALALVAVVLFAIASLRTADDNSWGRNAVCVAVLLMLLHPVLFLGMRHFVLPDQGEQIARSLEQLGVQDGPVAYVGKPALASKVRVCSGGRARLHHLGEQVPGDLAEHDAILIAEHDLPHAALRHYHCVRVSQGLRDLPAGEAIAALCHWRLRDCLERHQQHYVLAVRRR